MLHKTILSRSLQKGYVQCTACEHWCAVAPGEAGKCGVRRNIDGELQLLVYGRAIAAHVDPVEKKPLYHYLPAQPIFSIGTVGCNFTCAWCQNASISQYRTFDPDSNAIGQDLPPDAIIRQCQANDIPMVAFTYNEPVVFFEYAYDTARRAKQAGIRSAFVSSGFETLEAIDTLSPYLDAINIDLKAFRDETYRDYCGARLNPVLRNIEHIVKQTSTWLEVTTLVIPDLNDSDQELRDIAEFLADVSPDIPWHVSGFTPQYRMQDRPPTRSTTLRRAYDIGREAGLRYVYTGNIWESNELEECGNTRCPVCSELLLRRTGYHVTQLWNEPGVCPTCGTAISGVWQ